MLAICAPHCSTEPLQSIRGPKLPNDRVRPYYETMTALSI